MLKIKYKSRCRIGKKPPLYINVSSIFWLEFSTSSFGNDDATMKMGQLHCHIPLKCVNLVYDIL